MSDLTPAQRTRLGFFLLLAGGVLALIIGAKIGPRLFAHRDMYHVRMPGGVGGLQEGAQVTFNGITVGRVDEVLIDPKDVGIVDIELALDAGTPVPADTTATVAMQGITGLRYVELGGGTQGARRRDPGEEIPAGVSMFDQLGARAQGIAAKLDLVLDSVQRLTVGPDRERISSFIQHAESASAAIDRLANAAAPYALSLMGRVDSLSADVSGVVHEARGTMTSVRRSAETIERTVTRIGREHLDPLLIQASTSMRDASALMARLDSVAARAQSDLRAALDKLARGVESIGDLADLLRSDPSSLVFGRSTKPREAP